MVEVPRRRGSRLLAGFVVGIALTMATGAIVSADTELGHRGLVGNHSLRDQNMDGHGGARCDYSFNDNRNGGAATIKVRAPRVWARDRTAGVDHQKVGWRVIIQQTPDDLQYGTWYTVFTSSVVKAGATDSAMASFTPRTFNVPFNTFVRVHVQMFWYAPGSSTTVQGSAIHAVDYYDRYLDGSFEDQVQGSCPQDLTNP